MSRVHFVMRSLLSSLQLRLILGVTLLFLGSLWGFAWLLAEQQTGQIKHLLIEQQQATIGYVAEDLDQRLRHRLDNLVQAATILPLELLGDPVRLEEMLRQRPILHKSFDGGVIVVKPDGSGAFADYPPVPGRREHGYEHFTAVGSCKVTSALSLTPLIPLFGASVRIGTVVCWQPQAKKVGGLEASQ